MSALFLVPLDATMNAGTATTSAPLSNLLNDQPAMVWRSGTLTSVYFEAKLSGAPVNALALVGANLRAADTIRIRIASTEAGARGSSAAIDVTQTAWSGTAPTRGAKVIVNFTSTQLLYLRVDIVSTGNPAGYVEAARLIVGKALNLDGIDIGAEHEFVDEFAAFQSAGTNALPVLMKWKVGISGVTEAAYWTEWQAFFEYVGKRNAFLFVPVMGGTYLQRQASYCVMSDAPKAISVSSDLSRAELGLLAII